MNPVNGVKTAAIPGFKGRSGIYELLTVDEEIRQAITRNSSSSEIKEIAVKKRYGSVDSGRIK